MIEAGRRVRRQPRSVFVDSFAICRCQLAPKLGGQGLRHSRPLYGRPPDPSAPCYPHNTHAAHSVMLCVDSVHRSAEHDLFPAPLL